MPDIDIDFYPGSACENLGNPDGCVDGWHLYSIPLLSDSFNPYAVEEIFGECNSEPENIHLNGLQVMTEGSVGLCHTGMGYWIGSMSSYNSNKGYFTRNQFGYPFTIELESDLPDYNQLPVDNNGNVVWRNLNGGYNLVSFPGTITNDGYSCMTPTSDNWYYRIQYTLDQYNYGSNPITNKHDKLILSAANPEIDPDDFSWIYSYQDKIANECPQSNVCCHHICENDNGEYNCNSNVSLGWGNLGNLMCNYTNTCCNVDWGMDCTYLETEEEGAYNYGIDTSCQILHPKQEGICVYPDWDASPGRTENYCKSLPSDDCYDIDVCVQNDYCVYLPSMTSVYGECRISELFPLGDINHVADVPGSEYPFEWNPDSNPACGEGYLGHSQNCTNGTCMNAYHHCYACGGEWIPTGPLVDASDSCNMIADSIQGSVSNFPQLEVLTYQNNFPNGLNHPIWAVHGSRCFGESYGFWIHSEDAQSPFSFYPDMETYYMSPEENTHSEPVKIYSNPRNGGGRDVYTNRRCREHSDCPINFSCGNDNYCRMINSLNVNIPYSYNTSTLFDFDGLEWSIYMHRGGTGTDSYIPESDNRGPGVEIIPGGPYWDIPESLMSDVMRSGVTRNNYIPPMPINYKGGYQRYLNDWHEKMALKSKVPKYNNRKKSKKLKR